MTDTGANSTMKLPSELRGAVRYLRPHLLIAIAAIMFVVSLENPAFTSAASIGNLANSMAFVGFVALGETLLLITGEFDLSVGAVSGLSAVVGAQLIVDAGFPLLLGILSSLTLGAFVGMANGIVTVKLRVPAFVATLGMSFIASGLGLYLTRGEPVRGLPDAFVDFGAERFLEPFGLSWMFIIFIGLVVAFELVLHLTRAGRSFYATGGERDVARLAGIKVDAVKIAAFTITGLLAALAGVLQASFQSVALSTTGSSGVELLAVAAALIGGATIFGGIGTMFGTLVGLALLTVATQGLVAFGLPINWQSMAVGIIMIGAIALDVVQTRLRERRKQRRPTRSDRELSVAGQATQ